MKKRKNFRITNKKIMLSLFVFVLVGISVMTIAYATLSTTLKITGSAEFEDASWDLTLQKYNVPDYWEISDEATVSGNVMTYGKAKLLNPPTLTGTSINDYKISLG